jgi:hypothetical protein
MEKKTRTRLIFAGIAAAVLFVGTLAWHESRFPLRYLKSRRVNLTRASGIRSRCSRDLTEAEVTELCALLRSARRTESFDQRRSVMVELETVDYGRVMVYDAGSPGANLHINAGRREERSCTVHSPGLGRFLKKLAAELTAPAPKKKPKGKPAP